MLFLLWLVALSLCSSSLLLKVVGSRIQDQKAPQVCIQFTFQSIQKSVYLGSVSSDEFQLLIFEQYQF